MTKTLILHIGHYKTGTTALQVFCAQNEAALARRGIVYAQTERHLAKHSGLAFALLRAGGARTLMHGYRRASPPEAVWAPLLDEVRAAPAPAVLASSEEFMRLAQFPQAVAALRAILAGAPDIRLRVVAWLRPIQPHLRSWYNQLVKMGQCEVGFQTAVCTLIEPVHHDYALALAPWAELAGPGGLSLRPYGDALRQGDRLYADFCAALGIRPPTWPKLPESDPNPRLDDRLLDLVRLFEATAVPKPERAALLERARKRLDWVRRQSDDQLAELERLRSRAAAGLAQVARLAGPEFPLEAFLRELPQPITPAERQREGLVEMLMRERADRRAEHAATLARLEARIAELEAKLAAAGG